MPIPGESGGTTQGNEPQPTDVPRKLAGKFDTPEALEQGYRELERVTTENNQRLATMEKFFETYGSEVGSQGGGGTGQTFTDQYPGQTPDPNAYPNSPTLGRLYQNPDGVLRESEDRAVNRSLQVATQYINNQNVVNDFRRANPDLGNVDMVVAHFVKQQPTTMSPQEKLSAAATMTRELLNKVRQDGGTNPPTNIPPGTIVPSPSNQGSGPGQPARSTQPKTEQDELKDFVSDRVSSRQGKMSLHTTGVQGK